VSTSGHNDLATRLDVGRYAAITRLARHELNDFESQTKGGVYSCP
jgi:hypothetical protein